MAALLNKRNDHPDAAPVRGKASALKPLVLVVEDHDATRFLLEYLLGIRGCTRANFYNEIVPFENDEELRRRIMSFINGDGQADNFNSPVASITTT